MKLERHRPLKSHLEFAARHDRRFAKWQTYRSTNRNNCRISASADSSCSGLSVRKGVPLLEQRRRIHVTSQRKWLSIGLYPFGPENASTRMPAAGGTYILTSPIPMRQAVGPGVAWSLRYSGSLQNGGRWGGQSDVARGPCTGTCADFWCMGVVRRSRASTSATSSLSKFGQACPIMTREYLFGGLSTMFRSLSSICDNRLRVRDRYLYQQYSGTICRL